MVTAVVEVQTPQKERLDNLRRKWEKSKLAVILPLGSRRTGSLKLALAT